MRCPAQNKIFGVEGEPTGLSETLAGIVENPLENCILRNVYEGLDLMPCGHIPPNPSELLSSERMRSLLALCREQYDYVFVDLPPILETVDAGVLTELLSAYILVVRAGYSKIDTVRVLVETMQSMHAYIAGFVLNDVSARGGFGYYSHYG
jgi:capsular exopolysaccharide synthesis family protein